MHIILALALLAATTGPARAYDQKDLAACMALEPPAQTVPACTRMIADRGINVPTRSNMLSNRGWSYHLLGDDTRALADLNEALRLNPKNVAALSNRGGLYVEQGPSRWDDALTDLNRALELDPRFLLALNNRGDLSRRRKDYKSALRDFDQAVAINAQVWNPHYGRGLIYRAQFEYAKSADELEQVRRLRPQLAYAAHVLGMDRWMLGDPARAYSALAAAVELDPKSPYAVLLLDIVAQRAGKPSQLSGQAAALDQRTWPASAIRLLLGQGGPDTVLADANDPNPETQANHVCEANFYVGEWALRKGLKDETIRRFRVAAETCPNDYDEFAAAKSELKRLASPAN